jgi:tRNA(Ile)-lysidine synthase
MDLHNQFTKQLAQRFPALQKQHKLLLAVSGGADSVVMTDLFFKAGFDFVIAHCNFQLRAEESERDEKFVKDLAGEIQQTFFCKTI